MATRWSYPLLACVVSLALSGCGTGAPAEIGSESGVQIDIADPAGDDLVATATEDTPASPPTAT